MAVNPTFAHFSELSYRSALLIYLIGLVLAGIHYGLAAMVADKVKVAATAVTPAGTTAVLTDTGDGKLPTDRGAQEAKARRFGNMAQTMVWLGIIIQGASVVLRGLATGRFPWGNLYEYISLTTLIAMVLAAVVLQRKGLSVLWPWILVPVLALQFYGGLKLSVAAGPVVPALKSFWLPFHVSIVSTGAGIAMISGVSSIAYILRMWQAPGEEKGFFGALARPLPSAKKLDTIAYRSAIWALPVFGLGIVLGALWAETAWGRFWNWDPKETVSLITWILYAAYLHARSTSGWRDRKAAWINIVAFATMVFNLFFINLVVSGLHSYAGLN